MGRGRLFVVVFASFLFVGSANATSVNTDVTDLWWNPNESGWGMQMVNTGTYIYATIYVYGPDGKPIWYAAGLDRAGTSFTFTGNLYAATGPYFGSPTYAPPFMARQVGTMTFVLTTVTAGQLSYSVDGVAVTKNIQRQPLTLDDYSGFYKAYDTSSASGGPCGNSTTTTVALDITIVQNGNQMSQTWTRGPSTCTYTGTYSQQGRMGTFSSNYSCSASTGGSGFGTTTMFQMTNEPGMFMAKYQNQAGDGCFAYGNIVGVTPF